MPAAPVKFDARASAFAADVRQRVDALFAERGVSRHADWRMVLKTVALLALTFGAYGAILSNRVPPAAMLALAVAMGVGMAGIGFSISHDALHGAYSAHPAVNRLLGFSFDMLGANGYLWRITHNVIHHTYTNIQGVDEDLEVSPLIRLSPRSDWRPVHRTQPVHAWLLYGLSTLFWVWVKDYKYFLQRDLGPYKDKRHPRREIALLIGGKAFYYSWSLVLPWLVVRVTWWQFLVGYLAMHVTAGLILGVVFQLAHVVEGAEHLAPDAAGHMDAAWMVHQMRTTSNFATGNALLTWYVGGLNHQVEHHLFPRVCSIHYPTIRPIVREVAARHGVPYHEQPTLRAAVRSHFRMLCRFRHRSPADAAAAPAAAAA